MLDCVSFFLLIQTRYSFSQSKGLFFGSVDLIFDHDTNNNTNYCKKNECDEETNPSLLASCTSRRDRLVGVLQSGNSYESILCTVVERCLPGFCVLLHSSSLRLDNIDSLVLLLNQNTHLDLFQEWEWVCVWKNGRLTSLNNWASSPRVFSIRLMSSCRS